MENNSFSQEEFDKIASPLIDELVAEHKKEIEELDCPEWLVTSFMRLRRLADTLSRNRSEKTNPEIADEIKKILEAYPDSLFAYDEKCVAELERGMQEFFEEFKDYGK